MEARPWKHAWGPTMPGDPKECRTHALNCMLLAKQATSEESKQTFLHLSRSWTRLVTELEDAQAFLKSLSEIKIKQPPSLEDVVPLPKSKPERRRRRAKGPS
jgi:hypothetical protein